MFSVYADRAYRDQVEEHQFEEGNQFARLSAAYLEDNFRRATYVLTASATDPTLIAAWRRHDMNAVEQELRQAQIAHPDAFLVSIYSTDGVMRGIWPHDPTLIGQSFAFRDWYKGVSRAWKPYVSEVYRPRAQPNPLSVAVALPVLDEKGRPIAILASAYSLERISHWLSEVNISGARTVLVVDQHGQLLAGPNVDLFAPPQDLRKYEPVRRVTAGEAGYARFDHDGNDLLVSYVPIRAHGWGVLLEQPVSVVSRRVSSMRRQVALFFGLVLALAVACSQMVGRLYRSEQALTERLGALADSEARYRSIIHGATYGIYRAAKGRFLAVNPAFVRMLGYSSEDEVKNLRVETDLYTQASERRRLLDEIESVGEVKDREIAWKRKDGTPITVRLAGRKWKDPVTEEDTFEMIVQDVTEQKRFQAQLEQSQRLEAVGRLAGGIAHDFNNLLTVISGYSQMALERLGDEHPEAQDLREVFRASERAAQLTRQLLAFSRQQVMAPKVLPLNGVVSGMEGLMRRLLGTNIGITFALRDDSGTVKADPSQLEQVIMNLAVNARDAMSSGGVLHVSTSPVRLDHAYTQEHFEIPPGEYAMLAVSDTGSGMEAEVVRHIFEPFFTTKGQERGTGLGLATVYGIVKQSGGYISVYSEVGVGTTFKIYLPQSRESESQPLPAARPAVPTKGHERLLLVEDEDSVRELIRQVLTGKGYEVTVARNGAEALRLTEQQGRAPDLVVTDVYMQEMGGREVAVRLRERYPALRVIFMTGYTDDATLRSALSGNTILLQKPFHTEDLIRVVREALSTEVAGATNGGK